MALPLEPSCQDTLGFSGMTSAEAGPMAFKAKVAELAVCPLVTHVTYLPESLLLLEGWYHPRDS